MRQQQAYHDVPGRFVCVLPCAVCLILAVAVCGGSVAAEPPSFDRDVRPILKAACTHCHGEEEPVQGGVDLRLRRFLLRGLEKVDTEWRLIASTHNLLKLWRFRQSQQGLAAVAG